MSAIEIFDRIFNSSDEVEFKKEWENDTGYFDNAVNEKIESRSRFVCPHGRRGVLIPTPFGNFVVFERCAKKDILVANRPKSIVNFEGFLSLYSLAFFEFLSEINKTNYSERDWMFIIAAFQIYLTSESVKFHETPEVATMWVTAGLRKFQYAIEELEN